MSFDTTTTITWASKADQIGNDELNDIRLHKILEMANAGKTDSMCINLTPEISVRYWVDQAAAEEYVSVITAEAARLNLTVVSVEYGTRY